MGLVKDAGRRQLAWYVRNCLTGAAGHRLQAAAAAQLEVLRGDAEFGDGFPDDGDLRTPTALRRRLRELRHLLGDVTAAPRGEQRFERNIPFARKEFRLDDLDAEILLLLLRYESNPAVEAFVDRVGAELRETARIVAALLNAEPREVRQRLSPAGAFGHWARPGQG